MCAITNLLSACRYSAIVFCLAATACGESSIRHENVASMPTECAGCAIDLRVVWSSVADDHNIMAGIDYLEIGDTLWVVGEDAGSYVVRIDLAGAESELIDRQGEGPGEFRTVHRAAVHPSGDTLIVAQDRGIGYFTTALQEMRSIPLLVRPMAMVALENGTLAISQSGRRGKPEESVAFGLHVVGADGAYLASLRPVEAGDRSGPYWIMNAGAEPNTFWLLVPRSDGIVVEHWDGAAIERLRRFDFSPSWWVADHTPAEVHEQRAGQGLPTPRLPTNPTVVHDDGRVLWVGLMHFDANHARSDMSNYAPHLWYDGIVLALDRDTGGVLAVTIVDEHLYGFTRTGKLVLYDEYPNGNPRLQLAEVGLILNAPIAQSWMFNRTEPAEDCTKSGSGTASIDGAGNPVPIVAQGSRPPRQPSTVPTLC